MFPTRTVDPFTLNLDRIVDHLHRDHGVTAYVEQTGGGCATIFAGRQRPYPCTSSRTACDAHSLSCSSLHDTRHAAVAGPGTFSYTSPSSATLGEFYVGPDDDGETLPVDVAEIGCCTEADVATVIAAQAAKTDHQPLSPAEIDSLGFDGTRKSLPAALAAARAELRVQVDACNAESRRLAAAGVPLAARIDNGHRLV